MQVVSIAHNAVTAKLIGADRQAKLEVQRVLSYTVDGFEHMAAFKGSGWDGKSSFMSFSEGTFPRGFVHLVQQHLIKCGYRVQLVRKPFPEPLGPEFPEVDAFGYQERYDYQPQVMQKLVRHGQIIARVATGGGKSRIAKLCTARINRPTLFLTTRGVLMYQMADSFKALGKPVSIIGDGEMTLNPAQITCGMVQTIASWLEEITVAGEMERQLKLQADKEDREVAKLTEKLKKAKKPTGEIANAVIALRKQQADERISDEDLIKKIEVKVERQAARRREMIRVLATFEFVILEEAHEVSGSSFFEILRHCKNAHYRLALTATPFMKDSEESNMRLMASAGPIAVVVSEKTLIDRGILAKPYFKFINLKDKPEKLYRSTPWQRAYEVGITDNALRNKHVTVEAMRAVRYGLPVMVLVQHKAHGKILCDMMTSAGLKARYIFGEDDQASRKSALLALKNGEINVLIGSTILDVGVDVPAVGMVILAGGGKAEVANRQRIGRGLREKKFGPNVCFVVDFADDHNNHLKTHYRTRRAIVESTPGFAENIVEDFDYIGLGFERKAA